MFITSNYLRLYILTLGDKCRITYKEGYDNRSIGHLKVTSVMLTIRKR